MDINEFKELIIINIYHHMHTVVEGNYDYNRFSYDGIDRSTEINVNQHALYFKYLLDHLEEFYQTYINFSDVDSQELYLRLILYKCLGHIHFRIQESFDWEEEKFVLDVSKEFDHSPSILPVKGLFGEIRHHENIPAENLDISLDCWSINLAYTVLKKQYYLERNGIRIRPEKDEIIIDAGACFGDTAIIFATSVGMNGKVFAFDPLASHGAVIQHNILQNNMQTIVHWIQAGVGEYSNGVTSSLQDHSHQGEAVPGFSLLKHSEDFPILSIDDFVIQESIERLDFIKMDIEGFELQALKGAANSIRK